MVDRAAGGFDFLDERLYLSWAGAGGGRPLGTRAPL